MLTIWYPVCDRRRPVRSLQYCTTATTLSSGRRNVKIVSETPPLINTYLQSDSTFVRYIYYTGDNSTLSLSPLTGDGEMSIHQPPAITSDNTHLICLGLVSSVPRHEEDCNRLQKHGGRNGQLMFSSFQFSSVSSFPVSRCVEHAVPRLPHTWYIDR